MSGDNFDASILRFGTVRFHQQGFAAPGAYADVLSCDTELDQIVGHVLGTTQAELLVGDFRAVPIGMSSDMENESAPRVGIDGAYFAGAKRVSEHLAAYLRQIRRPWVEETHWYVAVAMRR